MKYESIIFDFDGVIIESNHVKDKAFYSIFLRYGKEIALYSKKYHLSNRGVSRFEKVKHVIDKFSLPISDYKYLLEDFSNHVFAGVCSSPLVDGVDNFLEKNFNRYNMYIISATPTDDLLRILDKINISQYFIECYGSPKNKIFWINYLIENKKISIEKSIFIGDASSDKKSANFYNIDFCLRLTGDNSYLNDSSVKYNINTFFELKEIIK